MTHVTTLKTFPTMRDAYDVLMPLYDRFKREHGRGEKVELFLASTAKAERRASFVNPFAPAENLHEIRCHYTSETETEMEWFRDAVNP